jgi:hypothetical protein
MRLPGRAARTPLPRLRARPPTCAALDALLGPAVDVLQPRRAALKAALLAAAAPTQRGARASAAQAAAVRPRSASRSRGCRHVA